MKRTIILLGIITAIFTSCGQPNDELAIKKAMLEEEMEKLTEITSNIEKLQKEIALLDTSSTNNRGKEKLVGVTTLEAKNFKHFLELQGSIKAENIAYVTPRGMGGQVQQVLVKQGDAVKKGQLLIKLDDALANQQISQLEVQLSLAKDIYERRKNLWEKSIGTEVELLQAKNNVDALEKQLSILKEQLDMTNVYAQISGIADMVNIKPGEFFSPSTAAMSGIRIVNTNELKLVTQVPENYMSQVKEGSLIKIEIPDINKSVESRISVKGKTIDPSTRSFYIEARIPSGTDLRPNQLAIVKILDYEKQNAVAIPVNTLQTDEKGKYVMIMELENGNKVARKRQVETGQLAGDLLEIKSGLAEGDQLITEGYQSLYDGQPVFTNSAE